MDKKTERILDYVAVDRLIPEEYNIKTDYVIFFSDKKVILISLDKKVEWIGTGLILGGLALALIGIITKNLTFFIFSITIGIFLGIISYAISPVLRDIRIGELKSQPVEKLCLMEGALILNYENIREFEGHEFESLPRRGYLIPSVPSYLYRVVLTTKFGKTYIFVMNRKTYEKCMAILDKFVSQESK